MQVVSDDVIEPFSQTRAIFSDARASPTATNAMEVMERPRRDKDLFDISLWWLPLILAAVVIALLLADKMGLFGF